MSFIPPIFVKETVFDCHLIEDGNVQMIAACPVYHDYHIVLLVTADQYDKLLQRSLGSFDALIQDIVPDMPKELREFFITGYSPAYWDELMTGNAKPVEAYAHLGYVKRTDLDTQMDREEEGT